MPQIREIRERWRSGDTISQISRDLNVDRKTVRKYINQTDFSPPVPKKTKRKSKLDPFNGFIQKYLEDGRSGRNGEPHTARHVFERLRDEHGYEGSYETVQKRMKALRQELKLEAVRDRAVFFRLGTESPAELVQAVRRCTSWTRAACRPVRTCAMA